MTRGGGGRDNRPSGFSARQSIFAHAHSADGGNNAIRERGYCKEKVTYLIILPSVRVLQQLVGGEKYPVCKYDVYDLDDMTQQQSVTATSVALL